MESQELLLEEAYEEIPYGSICNPRGFECTYLEGSNDKYRVKCGFFNMRLDKQLNDGSSIKVYKCPQCRATFGRGNKLRKGDDIGLSWWE